MEGDGGYGQDRMEAAHGWHNSEYSDWVLCVLCIYVSVCVCVERIPSRRIMQRWPQ